MIQWRKWNNIIHRDLGYLMVGLTLIYAISGFMLNHKNDWNPSYSIEKSTHRFAPPGEGVALTAQVLQGILSSINQPTAYTGTFRPDPTHIQLFFKEKAITLDLKQGIAEIETVRSRKLLRGMNILHLNLVGKVWTYIADFYAFALFLLSITGLFVLRGKKGITGRAAVLGGLGMLLPLILIIMYAK